jgi:hypothetical protein
MNFAELQMTDWDFARLASDSIRWREEHGTLIDLGNRFENMTPGTEYNDPWSNDWEWGYWIPATEDASIVLARMFLAQHGFSYEILWDSADMRAEKSREEYIAAGITPPPIFCYVILTNYVWLHDR